jgi:hypothetical protein
METLTVALVTGRSYKISWTCLQNSSVAAGPSNATVNMRSASGASVTTASTLIRTANIRVFNGTTEVFEFFTVYDALATETRTFGISGMSNGAPTQTFVGGSGRTLLVEDIGLT